jgi:DNA-binding response OmpR family regulator
MARILVVEDDPGIARVLVDYFETIGYSVSVATNGAHALDHVDRTPPDAIILDLMLPVVTGVEAARRLRRCRDTFNIPIVAITAFDRTSELDEILMVDALIPKPFDLEAVAANIRRLLTVQSSDGRARRH